MSQTSAQAPFSPLRVLFPVGLGTCLSLLGDTAIYTVLPTHTAEAGITLAAVGIMLSANRWIRLFLNGPAGAFYDRLPRRRLFVPALFAGALSTALYTTPYGFWPMLLGRLLWGVAWVGIWIGGNTIILDISQEHNRGRRVGVYQITFFLGAAGGALLGGILTDRYGYRTMLLIAAALTLLGAVVALLVLPETRRLQKLAPAVQETNGRLLSGSISPGRFGFLEQMRDRGFMAALALLGTIRLVIAGLLLSTFALYLAGTLGETVDLGFGTLGVTSLTGIMLSINAFVSMISAPAFGGLSDRLGNRWRTVAIGLVPGITGFSMMALITSQLILVGVPMVAVTGGSGQSLSITLAEEAGAPAFRSRRLGILFTVGDLGSALGPLMAFALIPAVAIRQLYLLAAVMLIFMFLAAWWLSRQQIDSPFVSA